MKLSELATIFSIFCVLASAVLSGFFLAGLGWGFVTVDFQPAEETFGNLTVAVQNDVASPKDRISPSQIHVYDDKIVIDAKGAEWSAFTDTNSMDPLLDVEANGLEIVPESYSDLQVGDVASYEKGNATIIHRIAHIDRDEEGWYAIFRGDNSDGYDVGRVRWEQIRRVLIGVIY